MRSTRIKQYNCRMLIHKKLTRSDNFTWGYLYHVGVVNMTLTSIGIPLLLFVLLRIRTTLGPLTRLATIPAGPVAWRNIWIPQSCGAFWERNSKGLTEPSLGLILLLRRTITYGYSRWAKLISYSHWSFSLRCTCLIGPFVILGSRIDSIVVLLGESVTHELIKSNTLVVPQGLHQLGTKPSLEASDFRHIYINEF